MSLDHVAVSSRDRRSALRPAHSLAVPANRRRGHVGLIIALALLSMSARAMAQVASSPPETGAVASVPIADLVAESALRFGIPKVVIQAVIQAESEANARAVSSKGAIGLMQIMPQTWVDLRCRYGLGVDPFDAHDNIIAGSAYLRELHDRYGDAGFLAAYNAGPARYESHLATGRPLPAETSTYVAAIARMLQSDGLKVAKLARAAVRPWTAAPLFPGRSDRLQAADISSNDRAEILAGRAAGPGAGTGMSPAATGLFVAQSTADVQQ